MRKRTKQFKQRARKITGSEGEKGGGEAISEVDESGLRVSPADQVA